MRRSAFFRVCPQLRVNRAAGVFMGFVEPSVKSLGIRLHGKKPRFFLTRTTNRPHELLLHFPLVPLQESQSVSTQPSVNVVEFPRNRFVEGLSCFLQLIEVD